MLSISSQSVDNSITSRSSIRAFLNKPVDINIIKDILKISSHTPSGSNTQPWKVYVVTGEKRDEIIQKVCHAQTELNNQNQPESKYTESFNYYPTQWISPFIERRKNYGKDFYSLLNIQKDDRMAWGQQLIRNYQFFGAPVGLFFTVNKNLGIGSKMDISMFIQNILTTATARGLATCPQAAWNRFHTIVLDCLNISPDEEELMCTISLGYADPDHIINTFKTNRIPVDEFATFFVDE